MTTILTQAEVESEMMRLAHVLEDETHRYADLCEREAKVECEYRQRHDTLLIHEANRDKVCSATERNARVAMACKDEFAIFRMAEAQTKSSREALVSLRHQIDALRTIAANIRAQT